MVEIASRTHRSVTRTRSAERVVPENIGQQLAQIPAPEDRVNELFHAVLNEEIGESHFRECAKQIDKDDKARRAVHQKQRDMYAAWAAELMLELRAARALTEEHVNVKQVTQEGRA